MLKVLSMVIDSVPQIISINQIFDKSDFFTHNIA